MKRPKSEILILDMAGESRGWLDLDQPKENSHEYEDPCNDPANGEVPEATNPSVYLCKMSNPKENRVQTDLDEWPVCQHFICTSRQNTFFIRGQHQDRKTAFWRCQIWPAIRVRGLIKISPQPRQFSDQLSA